MRPHPAPGKSMKHGVRTGSRSPRAPIGGRTPNEHVVAMTHGTHQHRRVLGKE